MNEGHGGGRGGSGGSSSFYAITPGGQRIEPDNEGVLHFTPEDYVVILGGGGASNAGTR